MKKLIAFFVLLLVSVAVISTAVVSGVSFSAKADDLILDISTLNYGDAGDGVNYTTGTFGDEYEIKYGKDAFQSLIILSDKPMTITGEKKNSEWKIYVVSPNGANLTLSNLTIELNQIVNDGNPSAALGIHPSVTGTVNITLVGDNVLKSGPGRAGLENNSVPIKINGDGSLFAEGFEGGAGIGGGEGNDGENITINGGTIYARSAVKSIAINTSDEGGGAGIGGGCGGKGSNITINDGTVRGIGIAGAGIGGGLGGDGEDITITDGKVYAKTTTVNCGKHGESAGIGGGCGGNARNITISGGEVLAKTLTEYTTIYDDDKEDFDDLFKTSTHSVGKGAAIGGGAYCDDLKTGGSCENIVIKGAANVKAYGGTDGAAIGGGKGGSCGGKDENGEPIPGVTIMLDEGGSIYTYIQEGAGIGGGNGGNGENINISGGGSIKVENSGGTTGAGIGGGSGGGEGKNINISGTVKIDITVGDGAGIGGGTGGDGSDITIALDDEAGCINVHPYSSSSGAGIGGGSGGNGHDITINSGKEIKVTSTSGAAIGGGAAKMLSGGWNPVYGGGEGSNITITGGTVIATSTSGAGIGGGSNGNGTDIEISGKADVTATGSSGAGIGGGSGGDGVDIKIGGEAEVYAESVGSGAGIGGGASGSGTNITISGGFIEANGSCGSAGIGGGMKQYSGGDATGITISGGEVHANGGSSPSGAGIGSGYNGNASGIEIGGDAKVTATGGSGPGSAGIGSGYNGNVSGIEIGGDAKVTATGGSGPAGAGIGSGYNGSASGITITGNATVDATGGSGPGGNGPGGAGIGCGQDGSCTDITISSGTVMAEGIGGTTGISGETVTLGDTEDSSYPLIHTNGRIEGLAESESESNSDLAIVFSLDETKATVYGGTVTLTKDPLAGSPCKTLTVKSGATLVTNNNLTLNEGVVLYLEADAHLYKYNKMTINGGEIKHEDKSPYVDKDADEVSVLADEGYGNTVCDICGKPEPHFWNEEEWTKTEGYHWHECIPEQLHDCSVKLNQLEKCSITDNSKKFGYGAHNYNFDDPKYDETENKLYYLCQDCNYKYSLEIPVIKIVKVDNNDDPLENAEFGLYTDVGCTTRYTSTVIPNVSSTGTTAIADGEAVVSFFAEPGKSYYIKELTAPEGYIASTKVYKAVIDETGEVTYSIVGIDGTLEDVPVCKNILQGSISIKIAKVDAVTNNPLVGAEFTLYGNEDFTVTITTETTAMEDGKAVASFAVDPGAMTYYIKETKAPEGYIASDKVYKAVVDETGKVTYSIVGTDGTSEDVLVCENTKTTPPQNDPTNPTDPTDPTTPTTPTTPVTPTTPTTPTTPITPTPSTDTTDSTTPAQPSNPSDTSNASDTDDKIVPDDSNPSTGIAGTLNLVIMSVGVCAAFLAKKKGAGQ